MTTPNDVISAFLDNEPFDPGALASALAESDGRAFLIDSLALRDLVQPRDAWPVGAITPRPKRGPLRLAMAAATLLIAASGGYLIGHQRATNASLRPPQPTQVLNLSDAKWQDITPGSLR